MQVVPGNAFQNTISSAAAALPSTPQPTTTPPSKAPDHAVKAAGRLHAALTAAGQKSHGPGSPAEFRPNAPRGSTLDILI
jgi:hypothetical protein